MSDLTQVDYTEQELLYNRFMAPALRSAVRAFAPAPGSRGLDVGCGPGGLLPLLGEAVGEQGVLIAADLSTPHLRAARDYAGPRTDAALHPVQLDLCAPLPFATGAFDWAWTADTINDPHTPGSGVTQPDAVEAIRAIARVVRPGGKVAAFYGNWLGAMLMPGYAHLEQRLYTALEVYYAKHGRAHPSFANENALGWFQAAGLEVVEVSAHTALYRQPLPEEIRRYLQRYVFDVEYREPPFLKAYALGMGLTEADWDRWLELSDPTSPDYLLDREDYFCVRYGILTVGKVAGEPE